MARAITGDVQANVKVQFILYKIAYCIIQSTLQQTKQNATLCPKRSHLSRHLFRHDSGGHCKYRQGSDAADRCVVKLGSKAVRTLFPFGTVRHDVSIVFFDLFARAEKSPTSKRHLQKKKTKKQTRLRMQHEIEPARPANIMQINLVAATTGWTA